MNEITRRTALKTMGVALAASPLAYASDDAPPKVQPEIILLDECHHGSKALAETDLWTDYRYFAVKAMEEEFFSAYGVNFKLHAFALTRTLLVVIADSCITIITDKYVHEFVPNIATQKMRHNLTQYINPSAHEPLPSYVTRTEEEISGDCFCTTGDAFCLEVVTPAEMDRHITQVTYMG